MTREQFLGIINKELTNSLSGEDIVTIIRDYCQTNPEYDKHRDTIDYCIVQILQTGNWQQYYERVKQEFMLKFHICTLYDKEKPINTPFGPQPHRQILGYF